MNNREREHKRRRCEGLNMRPQDLERMRCIREVEKVCDVKHIGINAVYGWGNRPNHSGLFIDHFECFKTKDKQIFIFDSPYIPSASLETENYMLRMNFRIYHLPLHTSFYIIGKCQPRLIAPPNSKADLVQIAKRLALGGFIGNTTLTHDFIGRNYPREEEATRFYKLALQSNFGEYLNERS